MRIRWTIKKCCSLPQFVTSLAALGKPKLAPSGSHSKTRMTLIGTKSVTNGLPITQFQNLFQRRCEESKRSLTLFRDDPKSENIHALMLRAEFSPQRLEFGQDLCLRVVLC